MTHRKAVWLVAMIAAFSGACGQSPNTQDGANRDGSAGGASDASDVTDAESPVGLAQLKHIIVIVMENHSFDSLYGSYPGAEGLSSPSARILQVDDNDVPYPTLPQSDPNIPSDVLPNEPFDITQYVPIDQTTLDLGHAFYEEQQQIAGGKMNRFVAVDGSKGLTVGHYPTEQLPLARLMRTMPNQVTLLDHFFHAAYGGSFLNHIWLVAAASPVFPNAPDRMVAILGPNGEVLRDGWVTPDGYAVNGLQSVNSPHFEVPIDEYLPYQTLPTIGDRLNDAGVDWAWYAGGWDDALAGSPAADYAFHHQPFIYFANYAQGTPAKARHLKDERDLRAGIAAGQLPPVSFLKPIGSLNQHPHNTDVLQGENYLVELIQSIMRSALWKDTAVIVTYDEHGGFWDHVPPPPGDRFGPGTRIPTMVFSPFAKGGIDSTTYDSTAIAKLIETRWRLPPLSARDAAQADMFVHAFDFDRPDGGRDLDAASDARAADDASDARDVSNAPDVSDDRDASDDGEPPPPDADPARAAAPPFSSVPPVPGSTRGGRLANPFAYIPPQCYAKTRTPEGGVGNSCYSCHQATVAPNFADDAHLQLGYDFRPGARSNPWRHFVEPSHRAAEGAADATDTEILAYVRESNYFDASGAIALRAQLEPLAPAWDGDEDGRWDGYVPDAWFRFDDRGFDVAPDGSDTGWRALAYYPLPGASVSLNGSMGDVLVRLDPALREDAKGQYDRRIYEINLAIVEALITRRDVPSDPIDENVLGFDVDLDGHLGVATRVAFDEGEGGATRMRYAGRANVLEGARPFPITPGLFPLGTEFLHSVRYLDAKRDGTVSMAARMKELRYAKKTRWFRPRDLREQAAHEVMEQHESPNRARRVLWERDRGVYNGQGWLLQGFIEAADGSLRPQSYEESVPCAGCHGGIGATTDSMFAMARKVGAEGIARGWFHWSQHGPDTLPEPRRADGAFEYELYLTQNAHGPLRDDDEVRRKFLDVKGGLRSRAITRLHASIAELFTPSAARAIEFDRAYRAVVLEQSFTQGRDVTIAPLPSYSDVPAGEKTGVRVPVSGSTLAH